MRDDSVEGIGERGFSAARRTGHTHESAGHDGQIDVLHGFGRTSAIPEGEIPHLHDRLVRNDHRLLFFRLALGLIFLGRGGFHRVGGLSIQDRSKHGGEHCYHDRVHGGGAEDHDRVGRQAHAHAQAVHGAAHDERKGVAGDHGGQEGDYRRDGDFLGSTFLGAGLEQCGHQHAADHGAQGLGCDVDQRGGVEHGNLADEARDEPDDAGLEDLRAHQDDGQGVHGDHEVGLHAREGEEARHRQLQHGARRQQHGDQDEVAHGKALAALHHCTGS